jgi:hypothetical protein
MNITFYFILASVGWQYECDKCTVSVSLVGIPIRNCIIHHGTITMVLYVQLRPLLYVLSVLWCRVWTSQ